MKVYPPCLKPIPPPPPLRPDWYPTGSVIVSDPLFGDVSLMLQPLPLHCWKSEALQDESYWMWLSLPYGKTTYAPTSGALFFASSWEYWVALKFGSADNVTGISQWKGGAGNGRIVDQVITITVVP